MPSTTIAQISWKTSTPSVIRPGSVSSSALSYSSFTTIIVLLIAQHTATYRSPKSPAPHPEAEREEEHQAERDAQHELQDSGDEHGLARHQQLLQIHLQTDHEQQQDQADFGDRLDALLILDEAQTDLRPDEHACQQVRKQQRLPQLVGDERQRRRHRDAQPDAGQEVRVFSHD